LALPETACLAICAKASLPFDLEGFHWGDDIIFDQGSDTMDVDTGFTRSTQSLLDDVIRKTLIEKCGYRPRDIIIFGFGQGGMLALGIAAAMKDEELGGIVSVGGVLPSEAPIPEEDGKRSQTPVLLCKGNQNSGVKVKDVARLRHTFSFFEVKQWTKEGDSMPMSREEFLPIIQFFAARLRSVRGLPPGSVEIR
jgi:predicted esterase